MKKRTIAEIHDKEIGHRKFALFIDEAKEQGYEITEIKEYNEKYKFLWNGYPLEFDKNLNISVWWQFSRCKELYEMHLKIIELQK